MKKYKLFTALSVIGAGLALASCGNANTTTTTNSDQQQASTSGTATTNTSASTNAKTDSSFVVNVKYPDGTPVLGARVQWCSVSNGTCYSHVDVDQNGQAYTNELEKIEGKFTVHLDDLPEGYTYNPFEVVQTHENHVSDITIIELQSNDRIDDSKKISAITTGLGYYQAKVRKGQNVYFYIDINEAGTYEIESYAISPSDLAIGYCGNDIENIAEASKFDQDSGNEKNFKYSFTVSEADAVLNKHYVFVMTESDTTSTFTFSILKK